MFQIATTSIPGCVLLHPTVRKDTRGTFIKTYQRAFFDAHGLTFPLAEEYFTVSAQGVLRGLHFQIPPMDLVKTVTCISGEVLDVAVDMRQGSPTFGQYAAFPLHAETGDILYLPSGLAHGFYTLSESATLLYKVSQDYAPECDTGIRWDSLDIPWPTKTPLLSARDTTFVAFSEFQTPFTYTP